MTHESDKESGPMQTAALIVATLTSFLLPFMGSSVNIALPEIQKDFSVDAVTLSWVATAFLLAAAVSLVPFGKLADIYGRKKVFFYGTLLYTLASLACGVAPSAAFLIVARIFQGAGSAMIFSTGIAILSSVYPPEQRGRVLGFNVAAVYTGLSCGPFFGGMLTAYLGWRSIFFLNLPLCLLIVYLIVTRLHSEWAEARGEAFDMVGALIYAGAVIALMLGFARLPGFAGLILTGAGLAGFGVFAVWEIRVRFPVFEVRLFTENRVFAFSCIAALINYSATYAVTFLLSLYLQYIQALSPQQAGAVLMVQPVLMAFCSPLAGRLSDRIEPRLLSSLGMALTAKGLALLSFVHDGTSIPFIFGCLVLVGIGFGLFSSPNMNAIMGSVERRYYGIASGSVGTMRVLGQMLSMGIATMIFTRFIGHRQIVPSLYPDFIEAVSWALRTFSILCAVGIFFSLVRGRLRD
ncbi:MAG: MFS transporter [Desulfobacterales bacterium]|nr:MFS transporter [Desulfobacterales bacterium]